MEMQEHTTLMMKNVLSYRGKMSQEELIIKSQEIERIMREKGTIKAGPAATTTFSVEPGAAGSMMDIEILIPLDKEIEVPQGFKFKPEILLNNALMAKHIGNPAELPNTLTFLLE